MINTNLCHLVCIACVATAWCSPVDFDDEGLLPLGKKPLLISLGSHCEIALTLRDCGLREAAFPFDWIVTINHRGLINLLNDDFKFFTDANHFVQLPNSSHPHAVKNSYYGFIFYHDWPFSDNATSQERYIQQLEKLKEKYDRRIDRFRTLRDYPGKVFFLRNFFWENPGESDQSGAYAEELRNALRRFFPTLDFTLVILSYTDTYTPDIYGIDGVIEYKIERDSWQTVSYPKLYRAILKEDTLLP